MKTLKLSLCLLLATSAPHFAFANLAGPYTPDTNTLVLLHLDEAAGNSVTTNAGSLGGNFISVNFSSDTLPLPVVTSMLGKPSFSTNTLPTPISFNNCESNITTGYMFGYDYNRDGVFEGDNGSGTSVDFLPMSLLNIGNGGQTPFTLEAIICPTSTAGNQEIICTDNNSGTHRGFQFRISSGTFMFQFITGSQALSANIPTTGPNAFQAGTWYHVAFTYDGTNGTLYWTLMGTNAGAANVIGSGPLTMGASTGTNDGPLCIGNRGRPTGSETFLGAIDEVRISSVARAANQMQFFSPVVTPTQQPVSQNVDYNQPVSFTFGASTTGSTLGYQWLFNSNGIAGGTNATYGIPHVAAGNAGYYYCVVTNTLGYSTTSSVAQLVVGAAHFIYHRYSFINGANDSIGTANGTLYGDATAANGVLTLDGTAGTYMQLATNIVNGTNQTAFTVESWATYGVNSDDSYLFDFGFTNNLGTGVAHAYLGYATHSANGQDLFISPSDPGFGATLMANNTLDGLYVQVDCVIDPPNQEISIYTNGVLEAITNAVVGLQNVNDVYSYIGKSLTATDPYLVANINELRLYSGALSPLSVAQTYLLGPGQLLADGPASFVVQPVSTATPLSETATFSAAATGYLPIFYQWFKNGMLIPGATNASYSYTPTLVDNGATFVCYATNTIGVTTYITNSLSATLGVFVPPTLSWLGQADGGQDSSWNTTSLDWTNDSLGGGIISFTGTNAVLFDDRSGGGDVDLEQAIVPFKITVNAASSYQFTSYGQAGWLAGQGLLLKENSGTLQLDLSNNLSGAVTISGGELQVGNDDSYGSLGSGPVTNNAFLSINRGDTTLNLGNSISGTGTLSFDGYGAVTLSGNNSYSGSTLLNNGIVYLTSATGLGATSGANVASGAQLYITANINVPQSLTLNGVGDGNGALRKGGAGATTETAPIFLAGATSIGVDSGATLTLSNGVSGPQALTAIGGGTLVLAANSSFNGGFTLNGPVVDLNANGGLGSGPVTVSGTGHFVLANGLNFANFLDATTVNPGSGEGTLMVNDNTNGIVTTISGPLEFDGSPSSGGDFVGPTTSGYLNVTGPLTNNVTGDISSRLGFVRYSGGGSYTTFVLNGGTASLGANNGLCTNAFLDMGTSGTATFDLNGFSQFLVGLADGFSPPNSEFVTNSGATPSTLTLDLSGGYTYSGVIGGNLALVITGAGSLDLAGTNTYTGDTTVDSGVLELGQPYLSAGSKVTVASGATLQMDFAVTNTVASLVLGSANQAAGVYNSSTSPSYLTGSGYLLVQPIATNSTNITARISGNTLSLSWPADHLGWILQSQTNALNVGLLQGAWTDMPGSANGTSNSITLDPTKPTVFYRLRYP